MQLNVQPCDKCGAIDARSATNCHKCGAEFPLPETFEAPKAAASPAPAMTNKKASRPIPDSAEAMPAQVVHPGTSPAHASPEPARATARAAPATAAAARLRRQHRRFFAVAALSLALAAGLGFVYFHDAQLARLASTQGLEPSSPRPGALKPTTLTAPKPAAGIDAPDAMQAPHPLPSTNADANASREPALLKECPQAVATLGLCGATMKQGKQ